MKITDWKLRSVSDHVEEKIPAWAPIVGIAVGVAAAVPVADQAGGGLVLLTALTLLCAVIATTAVFAAVSMWRRLTGTARRTGHRPMRMTPAGLAGCPSPRPRR